MESIEMLHPSLERFKNVNYLTRINRAFRPAAREMEASGLPFSTVEVYSNPDASLVRNLLTFRLSYDANQWLIARGSAFDIPFCLTLPFRNGVTLPYSIEILLNSHAPVRATFDVWLMTRGRWFTEPLNRLSGRRLRALRLPGVAWVHASGGLKHILTCGGVILAPDENCPTNRWIVYSAYQGFLFGIRPRVVKYLQAAVRLQASLNSW
jgi:hypothetical protein